MRRRCRAGAIVVADEAGRTRGVGRTDLTEMIDRTDVISANHRMDRTHMIYIMREIDRIDGTCRIDMIEWIWFS